MRVRGILFVCLVVGMPQHGSAQPQGDIGNDQVTETCREQAQSHLASKPSFYKLTLHAHLRGIHNVPKGAVLIIGDSITQGLATTAIGPNVANLGIGGDDTIGVLARVRLYSPTVDEASSVVLAIGVNDMLERSNDDIIDTYRCILGSIPAGPKVFIS